MGLQVDVYGSLIDLPDDAKFIENWGFPDDPMKQYWRRKPLPAIFDHVEFDGQRKPLFNKEQSLFAREELRRCREGFYFYSKGVLTYITGKHYFYLQWWFLEDGIYPDYRDTDRRYFLFLNYWEHILWCLGIFRGKKRREGASSQACSNLVYECIFYKQTNAGLVSKTEKDSKETFTDMVAWGYNNLPVFLKKKQLNREGSVTELIFGSIGSSEEEDKQRSKVNFRAPVLNAYDRGRVSRGLWDEGGKWPIDVPFSKFISIVSKTMIKGAKRVGFAECPSTVNELEKAGGKEFQIVWKNADQFKSGGRKTKNRFVTYFTPAYDGYEGFIDKYGMSVIDAPDEETYQYLVSKWVEKDAYGVTISELSEDDIRKGARVYIMSRREGLVGELLEEEIRQNPTTVDEMFEGAITDCTFNALNIHKRKKVLDEHPPVIRSVMYERGLDGLVVMRNARQNEKNFHWRQTVVLDLKEANKFKIIQKLKAPTNQRKGTITVDSYSNAQGGRKYGSKACAWIGLRLDPLNPHNTGRAVGMLYGRPLDKNDLHQQVMLAAEYWGFEVFYEHTADDYYTYFKDRGMLKYLGLYPMSLIDPTKRDEAERHKGTPITPFSLTKQLDTGITYVQYHCDWIDFIELLDNLLQFLPNERTKFDMVVSWLMLITILAEPLPEPKKPTQPLIDVYQNGRRVSRKQAV